jgi:hypothetical protein
VATMRMCVPARFTRYPLQKTDSSLPIGTINH